MEHRLMDIILSNLAAVITRTIFLPVQIVIIGQILYQIIQDMYKKVVVLLLLLALSRQDLLSNQSTFCWKDTYGRGVGVPISACPTNKDKIGLLCYTKCPAGYSRFGFDCHMICPSGFTNEGLFCRKLEYGRGVGFPWKFGDPLNDSGMFARCQKVYGKGNCEKYGLIVYPKCKAGYHSFGCCICRPNAFKCTDYGFKAGSQLDISCAKSIIIGDPKPLTCSNDLEEQAALCYTKCKTGYTGIGPVCWAGTPKGWVSCGMGAATTSVVCASTVFNQVTSVGMVAINIATFGASGEAVALSKDAQLSSDFIKQIKSKFADLKKLYDNNQDFIKFLKDAAAVAKTANVAKDIITVLGYTDPQPADITRVTAEIAALVDPTGVAGVVAAYSYPLCSTIKV